MNKSLLKYNIGSLIRWIILFLCDWTRRSMKRYRKRSESAMGWVNVCGIEVLYVGKCVATLSSCHAEYKDSSYGTSHQLSRWSIQFRTTHTELVAYMNYCLQKLSNLNSNSLFIQNINYKNSNCHDRIKNKIKQGIRAFHSTKYSGAFF